MLLYYGGTIIVGLDEINRVDVYVYDTDDFTLESVSFSDLLMSGLYVEGIQQKSGSDGYVCINVYHDSFPNVVKNKLGVFVRVDRFHSYFVSAKDGLRWDFFVNGWKLLVGNDVHMYGSQASSLADIILADDGIYYRHDLYVYKLNYREYKGIEYGYARAKKELMLK